MLANLELIYFAKYMHNMPSHLESIKFLTQISRNVEEMVIVLRKHKNKSNFIPIALNVLCEKCSNLVIHDIHGTITISTADAAKLIRVRDFTLILLVANSKILDLFSGTQFIWKKSSTQNFIKDRNETNGTTNWNVYTRNQQQLL